MTGILSGDNKGSVYEIQNISSIQRTTLSMKDLFDETSETSDIP